MKLILLISTCLLGSLFAHEGDHPKAKASPLTKNMKVSLADGAFVNVPNWGDMPEGSETIGWTHGGVVIDKDGLIYVSTNGDNTVIVYNAEGKIQRQFGKQWKGIHAMVIVNEGDNQFIYAARLWGQEVIKFNLDGSVIWRLQGFPESQQIYLQDDVKFKITAVAIASNGDIFLADGYGTDLIHQYDKDRNYIRTFGGKGKEDKNLNNAHGLFIDQKDDQEVLIICDRGNRKIKRFDLQGNYIDTVSEGLYLPGSIVKWKNMYAVAELKGGIALLDKEFKLIHRLGENPKIELRANFKVDPKLWKNGVFTAPHSCVFDARGNLYVADWNKSGRIQKFIRNHGVQ